MKKSTIEKVGKYYYCHNRASLPQHVKAICKSRSNSDIEDDILEFLQEEKIKAVRRLGEKIVGQDDSTLLKFENLLCNMQNMNR